MLESGLSYELRGVRALEQRDFTGAAEFFRKGVELTPGHDARSGGRCATSWAPRSS